MRTLITVAVLLFSVSLSYSQKTKVPPKHYPSLLWEISGNGLSKPSYLFGTMHVSSKMVFNLSDSFYLGIKNADVVALETDMGSWQEDFSRYDLSSESLYGYYSNYGRGASSPEDYLTLGSLKFFPYEKMIEMALYNSPSIINNFLYRSYSEKSSDFEEDTYLDLHIYQAGKKWGKKVCGVEDFDESMQLMKEAYEDAAKEKNKKERSYDYDEDFSYAKMEDAYRTGNLDLLDTINKVNSTSAAFDEKFLYKRNEIQAESIDSILKTKATLFVGVGAAHLPGQRGVIEMLRDMGYQLRPIKMTERDSRHKEEVENIRVPVKFREQVSADGFFTVNVPGKLYDFDGSFGLAEQQQFADMSNGSYYMITRINTNSVLWGHSEKVMLRKIDSVIYENIPGKILSKENITRNGYKGIEIRNRTRRGDHQRYNIFVTPFEIIVFKMSGNGDYVIGGTEADQFFSSIRLKEYGTDWKKWSPVFGGFEVLFPHEPLVAKQRNWQFMAKDEETGTGFEIVRTEIHNFDFVEEDSFDLGLMEESFSTSEFIDKQLSRKQILHNGFPALDAKYKYKDGSIAMVRYLIHGTHYYTIVAHGKKENSRMKDFLKSFSIIPFRYGTPEKQTDTSLYFTVVSPVPLEKSKKISMYPDNLYGYGTQDDEEFLEERMTYRSKLVTSDSTGEKIYVSFSKPYRYYFDYDTTSTDVDSVTFKTDKIEWVYRHRKIYEAPGQTKVFEYILGDPLSSRYVRGKLFTRDGVSFRLETQGDTLTKASSFITSFFETFSPSDTVKGVDVKEKKSKLFFQDFYSSDTMMHKRAVKNVNMVYFDSTDFNDLRKAISTLSWKEKKYMDVKNDFVWQFASIKTKESADYLKNIYFAAGDTIELQYTALKALLQQQTSYAYGIFRDIMVSEPPVLNVGSSSGNNYTPSLGAYRNYSYNSNYDYSYSDYRSGSFLDDLSDTLELTANIFKDILPLIDLDDYEAPIMELMGILIDSSLIQAEDYDMYQSKFLLEAKQLMKKQIIREKNRSIEKAQQDDEEDNDYYSDNGESDFGNSQLSLYATLLMPFWDKNPAVPQLINQMLKSNDKKLKLNTTILLLRNKKPVPDTMLQYFAGMDIYRYELYSILKWNKMAELFPSKYNTHIDLARSELFSISGNYNRPDTIAFIERISIQHRGRKGFVYFFKYKMKKDDLSWKLASVGIVPSDPKQYKFDETLKYYEWFQYDFSDLSNVKIEDDQPVKDQIREELKKMKYSKRNSAAEFYNDNDNGMNYDFVQTMQ